MPICTVCHKGPSKKELREAGYTGNWTTQEEEKEQARIRREHYRRFVEAHAAHNPKWARRWLRALAPLDSSTSGTAKVE